METSIYQSGSVSDDSVECRLFRALFEEECFMHQFVKEATKNCAILDLVFSDSLDLVRDVGIREGLGNRDHNMVNFNYALGV